MGLFLAGCCGQARAEGMESVIYSNNHSFSTMDNPESANWNIALKPTSSVPNAAIQVLLYAIDQTDNASDGNADINAFDIGNVSVECPNSIPGVFDFGAPEIIPAKNSHVKLNEGYYHKIICPYTGTGDVSQADFGFSNDNYMKIYNVTNPQNDPTKPNSQLIFSPVWISFTPTQVAQLTITSVRSVQVLATVLPQITFILEGLPKDGVYCGVANKNETTGEVADFGEVDATAFANVAQRLTVTTNLNNGYVVTAIQDDQMRMNSNITCEGLGKSNDACVPSATVNGIGTTSTVAWSDISQGRGLAYTLENAEGNDNVFNYTQGYRIFADAQAGETPVPVLSATSGNESHNYVCYRLVPTDNNLEGNYYNNLTYTITARF